MRSQFHLDDNQMLMRSQFYQGGWTNVKAQQFHVDGYIYLNAKVSQLLLKSFFLSQTFYSMILWLTSPMSAVQTTWKSDHGDLRLPIFDKKCKATQIWKVTELQYLTFYRVTVLHHLTFYSEKVFNLYLFSKSEGQTNPSRLFYAFGNVHYVNVFEAFIIWRNWPFKHNWISIIEFLMSQVKTFDILHRRQKYRAT